MVEFRFVHQYHYARTNAIHPITWFTLRTKYVVHCLSAQSMTKRPWFGSTAAPPLSQWGQWFYCIQITLTSSFLFPVFEERCRPFPIRYDCAMVSTEHPVKWPSLLTLLHHAFRRQWYPLPGRILHVELLWRVRCWRCWIHCICCLVIKLVHLDLLWLSWVV